MLLKRAGVGNAVLGYIPLVQFFPFLKMLKRPWWWFFILLCPGINLMMLVIINVELGIAFGKRSTKEQWFFGALPWVAISKLALKEKEVPYMGPRDWTGKKKSAMREWGEAIVFAVIAASIIRTFFFEAFTIPTPSMEKSMLVGDYLFVSKLSYGPKIPQTPVSVPFVHNTLPGSMTDSYVDWFSLPYFRLPGFGKVERFDPVVFNFPHGDTIIVDPFYAGHDYYSILRNEGMVMAGSYEKYLENPEKFNQLARNNFEKKKVCLSCGRDAGGRAFPIGGVKARPVDKQENYVKRCIGLPGEDLQIINHKTYINGQIIEDPEGMMLSYVVEMKDRKSLNNLFKEYKVNINDRDVRNGSATISSFTKADIEKLKKDPNVISITPRNDSLMENGMSIFPNSPMAPFNTWTRDNFGPIHIPAKGETIELTPENLVKYKRVIVTYEKNNLEQRDGKIFINGQETTQYTFKQNYYWMMGDNRHQSADSRYWGFVPEDHIVGKPVFTWFSKEDPNYQETGEIRWNRMFRTVK
ncbi:MAG TPA: signal peptidase I [Flavobacteriales bacterium]